MQPTSFNLRTYTLSEVFDDPALITSLSNFAYASQEGAKESNARRYRPKLRKSGDGNANPSRSILFLQVYAAADYFTINDAAMSHVPPVLVDVILDEFVLNIFPRSLLPTAAYILLVAAVAWIMAGYVWKILDHMASDSAARNTRETSSTKKIA
ncbi:MAG: hypothetical protein Q9160_005194 [Pyrenula sp. 1 TL-2023]